jgi:adenosine deaminase
MIMKKIVQVLSTLILGSHLCAASLPGVVLHEHLEATASVSTLRQIAKSNDVSIPDKALDFQQNYEYKNLAEFLDAYYVLTSVIHKAEDYYTITKAYLEKFKAEGGIYTEFMVCPFCAACSGIDWKEMIAQVQKAMAEVEQPGRFYSRMLINLIRGLDTPEKAAEYVEWAIQQRASGDLSIVGIHLSGDETAFPDVTPFIPVYQRAAQGGLGLAAHAGETTDAQNVIDAIQKLGVTRVGHGIAAVNSEEALNLIIEKNVSLEVCPTSNICTHAQNVTSYGTHPLGALVKAGVSVSLNADDSIFFRETTHQREMEHVANNFGYDYPQLRAFIADGITGSFAPVELKQQLRAILDGYIQKGSF